MKFTPVTEIQSALPEYVSRAVLYNEIVGIAGSEGNAVLISEDEYEALMETVFLMRSEKTRMELLEAAAEELETAIDEEDVAW